MRSFLLPFEAGRSDRAAEYRLPVRHAGKRRRVEARERMEGIALQPRALDRRIQELQIEERIVADEDRARARCSLISLRTS